jgi:hypothetical protein
MKNSEYLVIFTTWKMEIVYAITKKEAEILAMAEQIKKWNSFDVSEITCNY